MLPEPTEPDINEIAAHFLTENIDRIVAVGAKVIAGARAKIRSRLERTYRQYLVNLLNRYSKSKSFFIRSEAVPLYRFYVPASLQTPRRRLRRVTITDISEVSTASIVFGLGGSGKSMLMRHLLIDCIASARKVPVFVELRFLNNKSISLREHVLDTLQVNGLEINDDFLEHALDAGHFCFLLDGFDELETHLRYPIASEIAELPVRYPDNWVIMSSRPDSGLEGWDTFLQFSIARLSEADAIELIDKLPFENRIKDSFIEELESGLFASHESFLSNPLLLSIMLLTYHDNQSIPSHLTVFYELAYETLFQKHDALKRNFQRKMKADLDIRGFANAFSAFSLLTFEEREFSFTRTRGIEHLDKAKDIALMEYSSSDVLDDAMQAVCLLVEDGTQISFVHRSFQEYFVAKFIASSPPDVKRQLMERYLDRIPTTSVFHLAYELDPHSVEDTLVIPVIEDLNVRINVGWEIESKHHARYLELMYYSFELRSESAVGEDGEKVVAGVLDVQFHDRIEFVARLYGLLEPPGSYARRVAMERHVSTLRRLVKGRSGRVLVKSIPSDSRFAESLREDPGLWGISLLESLCVIPDKIRERRGSSRKSLEEVLRKSSRD